VNKVFSTCASICNVG